MSFDESEMYGGTEMTGLATWIPATAPADVVVEPVTEYEYEDVKPDPVYKLEMTPWIIRLSEEEKVAGFVQTLQAEICCGCRGLIAADQPWVFSNRASYRERSWHAVCVLWLIDHPEEATLRRSESISLVPHPTGPHYTPAIRLGLHTRLKPEFDRWRYIDEPPYLVGGDYVPVRSASPEEMAWKRFVVAWATIGDAVWADHRRRCAAYFVFKKWRKRWIRAWRMIGAQYALDADRFVNPAWRTLDDPIELRFAQLEIS